MNFIDLGFSKDVDEGLTEFGERRFNWGDTNRIFHAHLSDYKRILESKRSKIKFLEENGIRINFGFGFYTVYPFKRVEE